LVALPIALAVAYAGAASAAGPVQPGVTPPNAQAGTTPGTDQTPQLLPASPQQQEDDSTPVHHSKPDKNQPPAPPPPRQIHIGGLSAPVPDAVPDNVIDGLNGALNPNLPQPPKH
jgi:hypothetical protein